jgi:hypothetical protein
MLKVFVSLFLSLGSLAFAGGTESIKAPLRPVSVSYEGLLHCFPDLADAKFSMQIKLDALKDSIDYKYVTTNSLLRYRKVQFKKDTGSAGVQLLTLGLKTENPKAYELRLEKLDSKEGSKAIELTQAQRSNPTPKLIDQYLLEATIESDDTAYEDTKVKGLSLSFVRGLKGIQQLELRDKVGKKTFTCSQESDLGTVCSCLKM